MSDKHKLILETIDLVEREDGAHPALWLLRTLVTVDKEESDQREVARLLKSTRPKRPWWRFW